MFEKKNAKNDKRICKSRKSFSKRDKRKRSYFPLPVNRIPHDTNQRIHSIIRWDDVGQLTADDRYYS